MGWSASRMPHPGAGARPAPMGSGVKGGVPSCLGIVKIGTSAMRTKAVAGSCTCCVRIKTAGLSDPRLSGNTTSQRQRVRVSPTATTAWLVAPRALPPPSTRVSAARARPAAARHRVPGASPVSGVLDLGAASSTGRAHVPRPCFPGCPIVLVACFPLVLENELPGFCLTRMDQS